MLQLGSLLAAAGNDNGTAVGFGTRYVNGVDKGRRPSAGTPAAIPQLA